MKATVYSQLEEALGQKLEVVPDNYTIEFDIDFYIEVRGKKIGISIKKEGSKINPDNYKAFEKVWQTKVFVVYFEEINGEKIITEKEETIERIKNEIDRVNGAIKVGDIVSYLNSWYRVTRVSKNKVNLGSTFGKTIYHKGVDIVMVKEDRDAWWKSYEQSETYKCS